MAMSYIKNKIHIYNYRAKNTERLSIYHREFQRKYNLYAREARIFRNILF